MDTKRSGTGTQVVGRVADLLRTISTTMPEGLGTSEMARRAQMSRPTAHRILDSLAVHGLVDRDPETGHWMLGPEIYLMGAVAAEKYDITELARPHVTALSEATGESAFLSARRGGETVCLLRVDGSFPIRSFVLYEGKRFPLGVASAGIAILSFLPEQTVARYLEQASLEQDYGAGHNSLELLKRIRQTRSRGYAVNPGLIVEGSWGMGAAVFDRSGEPAWALSLTGIQPRFTPERQREMGKLMLRHAHQLTQKLAGR